MELVTLAKNPVPSGAATGLTRTSDGLNLRYARWDATRGPRRGTVCVFQGRTEYIEKYFEVVADLRRRGFAVATFDWRGQGGSDRLLRNPRKGYVRTFTDFDRDLAHFMKDVVLPDCPPPFIALAHSMGGNILLRNASHPGSWFSRMILSAPMVALAPETVGTSQRAARLYAETMSALGLGSAYVRSGGDKPSELAPFEGNALTSDRERFHRNRMIIEKEPRLALGSPTIAWLKAAYRSMAKIGAPDYPKRVEVPLLLFAAGQDTVVSTPAIEAFAQRLKIGTHVLIPQSRHEILQESDEVRKHFWAAFDAYVGLDAEAA
jgi:lysophospholipase